MARADQAPSAVVRSLVIGVWTVVAAGWVGALILGSGPPELANQLVLVVLGGFFVLQVSSLLLTAVRVPRRRAAVLALLGGMVLWTMGSLTITVAEVGTARPFPAPGELLFVSSYLGLAAYLMLDVPSRVHRSSVAWLDAVVVCGGVACVIALVLVRPVSAALGQTGAPLLLALLYPLLDLALIAILLAQVVVGEREAGWSSVLPGLVLLLLVVADSSLLVQLRGGSLASVPMLEALWGNGFALLGTGAVLRRRSSDAPSVHRPAWILVGAALSAVLALALRPTDSVGLYVTVPAVLTLVGSGARMWVALGQARRTAEAVQLSLTDELTGLANRRSVLAALTARLTQRDPLALLLLDLDGFKEINDSLGHSVGDTVLGVVARRLADAVGPEVAVSRLGGDEFALLVPDQDHLELLELARDVRETLLAPLEVDGMQLAIRSSVGIAVAGADNRTSGDLRRQADVALYEAKDSPVGAVVYDVARDGFSRQRLRLGEELRQGISQGQLQLWYQPQLDARTRAIVSVEALVRWEHPVHGLLQPSGFLPGARRWGLMPALSEAVVRQAVEDLVRWRSQGLHFRVAVNLAPAELLGSAVLATLYEVIAAARLEPGALVVEVTEDSFLSDPQRALRILQELREHHVEVSIDDYGSGFSSLSSLRDLPVQEVKVAPGGGPVVRCPLPRRCATRWSTGHPRSGPGPAGSARARARRPRRDRCRGSRGGAPRARSAAGGRASRRRPRTPGRSRVTRCRRRGGARDRGVVQPHPGEQRARSLVEDRRAPAHVVGRAALDHAVVERDRVPDAGAPVPRTGAEGGDVPGVREVHPGRPDGPLGVDAPRRSGDLVKGLQAHVAGGDEARLGDDLPGLVGEGEERARVLVDREVPVERRSGVAEAVGEDGSLALPGGLEQVALGVEVQRQHAGSAGVPGRRLSTHGARRGPVGGSFRRVRARGLQASTGLGSPRGTTAGRLCTTACPRCGTDEPTPPDRATPAGG